MRREADDHVPGVGLLDLEEVRLVDDLEDQLLDVVGLVRVVGDQRVEREVLAVGAVLGRQERHARLVVRGQEVHEAADLQQRLDVVVVGAVGDRRLGRVHLGAAELLGRHRLVGHGLHDVGAGDEHVARVAHHEDEVGHGRRVDVAARARPHDDGDLRDDARGQHVAQEHLAVAAERVDAFLDARAAGIEEADDRGAVLQRHVLDLHDLLGVRLGERAAEDGEVLGEDADDAAVDGAPAGDDAVARRLLLLHAELGAAVLDEGVELLEGVLVHQKLDALAGGELAALVLGVDAHLTAAKGRVVAPPLELLDDFLHWTGPRFMTIPLLSGQIARRNRAMEAWPPSEWPAEPNSLTP